MADDIVRATRVVTATPAAVYAVLADPAQHAAIDGTGWVSRSLDSTPLTARGQIFRMAMYHPKHPDGNYVMHNRVELFDPPHTIAWQPGYDAGNGSLGFGGWIWRYDLTADDLTADDLTAQRPSHTTVTLSYDWSAVPDPLRDRIGFPPFPPEHLDNSLAHLAQLLER